MLSPTWQQYSGTYIPPVNAAYVKVLLFNNRASGWVTFDDVVFKKSSSTEPNLVVNPGFESVNIVPINTTFSSQSISMQPGSSTTVSAALEGNPGGATPIWSLHAIFYNAANMAIGDSVIASDLTTTISQTPQTVTAIMTSPIGTASLKVELRANLASGRIAFSNVTYT